MIELAATVAAVHSGSSSGGRDGSAKLELHELEEIKQYKI